MPLLRSGALVALALPSVAIASACTDREDAAIDGERAEDEKTDSLEVPPVLDRCAPTTAWDEVTPAFANATESSNFKEIGARSIDGQGMSFVVSDIDSDGYADVYAYQVGVEDFNAGGKRISWLLHNRGDLSFDDITEQSGFLARRYDLEPGRGRRIVVAAWADIDQDGDMDAFTAARNREGSDLGQELSINNGDGTFSLSSEIVSSDLHMFSEAIYIHGASFLDANRDGLIDLFIASYEETDMRDSQRDRLYLQQGDGTFAEATAEVGLMTQRRNLITLNAGLAHARSWSSLACDLNNDGDREILVGAYGRSPNLLWKAGTTDGGDPSFENRSVASGYAYDHRDDWTVDNSARCYCSVHPEAEDCDQVPPPDPWFSCNPDKVSSTGFFRWHHPTHRNLAHLGGNSGTTICADINGDGWMDLVTHEIVHWDVGSVSDPSEILYNRRDPEIRFERPGNQVTGLERPRSSMFWDDGDMSGAVLDFDNDGLPDILIGSGSYRGTRLHLFHQQQDGTFEYVPVDAGIDFLSNVGVAVADFDRDGDVDLILGHSTGRCSTPGPTTCYEESHLRLFENRIGNQQNWLQLRLVGGPETNRAAIGARVTVQIDGEERVQVQEVDGGHGRRGIQHDQVLHFGLGDACSARITIRWPDRELSIDSAVLRANHRYVVFQDERIELDDLPEPE